MESMEAKREEERANTGESRGKNKQGDYVHRVGTVTFGVILILFGGLFLAHLFFPVLEYRFIFQLWPVVLIGMGTEVLAYTAVGQKKFTYDWAAVVMLLLLLIFSMCMAGADWAMEYGGYRMVIWQ